MKRILFILTLALVALAGCKKEPAPGAEPGLTPDTPTTIVFKTSRAVGETITLGFNGSEIQNISIDGAKAEDVTVNHSWRIFKLKLTSQTVTVRGDITVFDCRNNGITEIALTKDLRLYDFNCSDNELTSLDVSGLTELEYLSCVSNKLTSLNIEGCESIFYVACYKNVIKGEAMTDIVNALPEQENPGDGRLVVTAEGCENVITEDDIDIADAKNWDVMDNKDNSISQRTTFTSPANCYIVPKAGTYSFKTVKGNSSESVGSVASAKVLWETFGTDVTPAVGDLVKNVSYSNGVITFTATDRKGNAVIAAKDASGKILWSWHIWLTDQPKEHVYMNNAGTMMDRNLGATSAIPGHVATLGLLYQWGRKDPFLGSSSISTSIEAKSTITWPSAVETSSSVGTVDFVTSNPTTFLITTTDDPAPLGWHCSYKDINLWTSSDKPKSIYDPCPAGWRVPDGGEDGVWGTALIEYLEKDELYQEYYCSFGFDRTNLGTHIPISSSTEAWYPAAGIISGSPSSFDKKRVPGVIRSVGIYGGYHAVSSDDVEYMASMDFTFSGYTQTFPIITSEGDLSGTSVRCIKE